jgi:site-specific recombinase XerD
MLNNEVQSFLEQALGKAEASTEMSNLIEGYSLCARSEGKSVNTVELTRTAVKYLTNFLVGAGLPTRVGLIGVSEIRSFILHLKEARRFESHPLIKSHNGKLTGHTINCYLRSISAFWGWLLREGFINSNPFAKINIPKAPRKVITPFTEEQIRNLVRAIDTSTITGLRNYAMVLMFLDTGMRLRELTGLRMNDVDLRNRTLKVFGKGAKERRLPIGKRLLAALWKYQLHRPQPATGLIDNFFLTQDGWPFSKNRVETIIKNLGKKARIRRCPMLTSYLQTYFLHTISAKWCQSLHFATNDRPLISGSLARICGTGGL